VHVTVTAGWYMLASCT